MKALLVDLAMAALLMAALLLSLLLWVLFCFAMPIINGPDNATPFSLIILLLISALTATTFQSVALRSLGHSGKRNGFWLLVTANTLCLCLAGYRTLSLAFANRDPG